VLLSICINVCLSSSVDVKVSVNEHHENHHNHNENELNEEEYGMDTAAAPTAKHVNPPTWAGTYDLYDPAVPVNACEFYPECCCLNPGGTLTIKSLGKKGKNELFEFSGPIDGGCDNFKNSAQETLTKSKNGVYKWTGKVSIPVGKTSVSLPHNTVVTLSNTDIRELDGSTSIELDSKITRADNVPCSISPFSHLGGLKNLQRRK